MENVIKLIRRTKSLQNLCDLLNELTSEELELIDLSDLPLFSANAPDDTLEIFSYDDTNYLMFDNEWELTPRAEWDAWINESKITKGDM